MKKMSQAPVAFSDVAAIVKANLSGWYLLLALLLFSVFMSGSGGGKDASEISGRQLFEVGYAPGEQDCNYSGPLKCMATLPKAGKGTIAILSPNS